MTKTAGEPAKLGGEPIKAGTGARDSKGGVAAPMGAAPADMARLLAALEPALDVVAGCARCSASQLGRWGTTERGVQRWRCRACGRTCTAASGTPFARLRSVALLRRVAADMLAPAPRSCRALAAACGLDRMTIWRWRRLIVAAWARLCPTGSKARGNTATGRALVLRESRKASREWVRHRADPARHQAPDRLRWIDYRQQGLPLPEPMAPYRVHVSLSHGCLAATRRGGALPAATASLAPHFRHFLAPFAGPATRHLRTYVIWFGVRHGSFA